MKKIDKAATDYLNKVRHMSPEKRTNQLNQIESMFTKSREYGDDKVSLAMQTYEMVSFFSVLISHW